MASAARQAEGEASAHGRGGEAAACLLASEPRDDDPELGRRRRRGVRLDAQAADLEFTPVMRNGRAVVSRLGDSCAKGAHASARKGVRAVGYDGRALSSVTPQPDRPSGSCAQGHVSAMMGCGAMHAVNVNRFRAGERLDKGTRRMRAGWRRARRLTLHPRSHTFSDSSSPSARRGARASLL